MAPAESGDCLFTHSNSDPCPRQALLSRLSQSACSHHQKNRPLRQLHAVLRRHLQEYFDTHDSIPNALNLTSNAVRFSYIDRDIAPLTLERSRYFESLSERGYQINVYQSDFLDYCSIPSVRYGVCDTYRILSIGDLSDTSLSTAEKAKFILNSLVDASYRLTWLRRVYGMARERGLPLPRWTVVSTRIGPLPVLPLLQRLTSALRKAEGGNVYFAHLMMPHFPYALDAQCQVRPQVARWRHRTLRQTGPVRNTSSSRGTATVITPRKCVANNVGCTSSWRRWTVLQSETMPWSSCTAITGRESCCGARAVRGLYPHGDRLPRRLLDLVCDPLWPG